VYDFTLGKEVIPHGEKAQGSKEDSEEDREEEAPEEEEVNFRPHDPTRVRVSPSHRPTPRRSARQPEKDT
jgi:hypothetical protein